MKNALLKPFFEEQSSGVVLAPVIPIKSVRMGSKKGQSVEPVKVQADSIPPKFTAPIFKPKKHDMF